MSDETQVSLEENSNEEQETSQEPELDLELEEIQDDTEEEEAEPLKSVEAYKAEIADLRAKNKQLYARAKKNTTKAVQKPSNSILTREEAVLYAKGHTDEEVNLAVKLSKISGENLLIAVEDPYFKAKVSERLRKERSEKASLGASSGSGKFTPKDVGKMSEEEHAKLFQQVMSKVQ